MSALKYVVLGDIMLDLYPAPPTRPLAQANAFVARVGGGCANAAIHLARAGGRVSFVGGIARDPLGDGLRATLKQAGIEIAAPPAQGKTPVNFVSLDASGVPSFQNYGDAHLEIQADWITPTLLRDATWLHFSSTTLLSKNAVEATERALTLARGIRISCDLNLRGGRWRKDAALRALARNAVARATLVKATALELQILTETEDPLEGAAQLGALGPAAILISEGPAGCRWWRAGRSGHVPAAPARVVDTTGAGDAFIAAALGSLGSGPLNEAEIIQAVQKGCEAGARACEHVGAIGDMGV